MNQEINVTEIVIDIEELEQRSLRIRRPPSSTNRPSRKKKRRGESHPLRSSWTFVTSGYLSGSCFRSFRPASPGVRLSSPDARRAFRCVRPFFQPVAGLDVALVL